MSLVLAILRQAKEIPVEFKPSVTIAANCSGKTGIPISTNGVIELKAPSV